MTGLLCGAFAAYFAGVLLGRGYGGLAVVLAFIGGVAFGGAISRLLPRSNVTGPGKSEATMRQDDQEISTAAPAKGD